jgi:hypothetical protein
VADVAAIRASAGARTLIAAPVVPHAATNKRLRRAPVAGLLEALDMDIDAVLESSRIKAVG